MSGRGKWADLLGTVSSAKQRLTQLALGLADHGVSAGSLFTVVVRDCAQTANLSQ